MCCVTGSTAGYLSLRDRSAFHTGGLRWLGDDSVTGSAGWIIWSGPGCVTTRPTAAGSPFPEARFRSAEVTLQPGDRLVIVTDGMQDRHAAKLDLPAQLRTIAGMHPREAVRALADAVLAVAGPALTDDATLLIIDWHGRHGRPRNGSSGADLSHATSADPRLTESR